MSDNYEVRKGFVINDPDYGTIAIGKDKNTERPRQVQISSASGSTVRLFEDGGFEIRSAKGDAQRADNILSQTDEGLLIKTTGLKSNGKGKDPTPAGIHIDSDGTITISAKDIVLQATGTDSGGISILSNHHINIVASDNVGIEGSQIGIGAINKMVIASSGPLFMCGRGGVNISEPKEKLIPTSIKDILEKTIQFVFPDIC